MTRSHTLAGVATIALITQGCTTELATRADLTRTGNRGVAMVGIPYNLPMLQYHIDVTRTLTRCAAVGTDDDILADPEPRVDFAMKVAAKPSYVRGESYVVDYQALNAWSKTTSFSMETYPTTGNLKTVSASAEDHTGDIIKDVAKVAFIAASFAAGGPAAGVAATTMTGATAELMKGTKSSNFKMMIPSSASDALKLQLGLGELLNLSERNNKARLADDMKSVDKLIKVHIQKTPILDCKADTRALVDARKAATKALDDANDALTAANTAVADATILIGVRGVTPARKERDANTLSKSLSRQSTATTAVEMAEKASAEAAEPLTDTQTIIFPSQFDKDNAAFASTASATKFHKIFERVSRRVVFANELAKALVAFQTEIGADRWKAVVTKRKVLSLYVDGDNHAVAFTDAVTPDGTPRSDGKAKDCPDNDLEETCIDKKLLVSGILRSVEKGEGSHDFPTLDGRIVVPPVKKADATVDTAAPVLGAPTPPHSGKTDPKAKETNETRTPIEKFETARDGKTHGGLFIRPPVVGELVVCRADNCSGDGIKNLSTPDPKDPPTYVPQFGQLRFLPFHNGTFANNTLTLKVETDGSLTSFEYKTTKSVAAELAATAANVAAQADAARTKARTDTKDSRQANIDALQYQIDSIAKTKALAEAQNPKDTKTADTIKSETVDLTAQAALVEAKLTRLKAEAALAAYAGGAN